MLYSLFGNSVSTSETQQSRADNGSLRADPYSSMIKGGLITQALTPDIPRSIHIKHYASLLNFKSRVEVWQLRQN